MSEVQALETPELSDVLPLVLSDVAKDKELQREIEDVLNEKYNIDRGTFSEIVAKPDRIEVLNEDEVIVILNTLLYTTKDERINPSNFYNQKTIKLALKFEQESEEISFPQTIPNVLMLNDKEYVTIMSYKDLALWLRNKLITYNFDCQRLPVEKINKKGKITVRPKTNLRSIRGIVKRMLEGEYSADTIIINILSDGNDRFDYSDNGDLTIYEGTTADDLDGWHRLQAISQVIEIEPNFEGQMIVSIKNYTLKKSADAYAQFNTVNPSDKVLVRHRSEKGHGRNIAKQLQANSDMKGRISIRTRVDKKMKQITNMDVLSRSIDEIFIIENDLEEELIYEHLKRFFGILINSYPAEFKDDMYNVLQKSWINHHNSTVGHVVIAKKIYDKYGKNFTIDNVKNIIDSINWNKDDSSDYHEIMKEQGNRNSNQIKSAIRKYFEEKVSRILSEGSEG